MQAPRRFDSLRASRAPSSSVASQEEPIDLVVRRLFLAGIDGPRVLAWMQDEVSKPTPLGCSEAVLREAEGSRRFVQRLIDMGRGGTD